MIADEIVILLRCFTFHPSHIIRLDTALHLIVTRDAEGNTFVWDVEAMTGTSNQESHGPDVKESVVLQEIKTNTFERYRVPLAISKRKLVVAPRDNRLQCLEMWKI